MLYDFIGEKSHKVTNIIEQGAVVKFAKAIGETHPMYTDVNYAEESEFGNLLVPATYPVTLNYGEIKGMKLPSAGLIHGEQSFHYHRPLLVGEEVHCYREVTNYAEKEAKSGTLGMLTLTDYGEDEHGEVIYKCQRVVILTETVRKELSY
ncbi:MaoC family dehydratase N-terminal domain-containing protein [Piscibacillus salipiscarius]|uniref:MaoC family dehydratase N-terminal domain-containing protein n=1 Tax=Piscibacillus salipiscarius TaxID=299480 RepID=A0ABW5QDG2_9BACI|nr:MaoC family dehydratase N-terminal domain-containing protein [Piscibacillus salipiscarius]